MHQFEKELCDNCWSEWTDGASPDETSDAKKRTAAEDNTTDDFVGQVAMLRPDASWVARWLRMHKSASSSSARVPFKPGLYAISLPTDEAQQAQQEEGGGGDDEDDEMDRGNRAEGGGEDEEEEEDKKFIDDGEDEGGDDEDDDDEEEDDDKKGGKKKGSKRKEGEEEDDDDDDDDEEEEEKEREEKVPCPAAWVTKGTLSKAS
jgi:hypothetical protein